MRHLALALTACVLATSPSAGEDHEAWLGLDQELSKLKTTVNAAAAGETTVGGYLVSHYASTNDFDVGSEELGGWRLRAARIEARGNLNPDWSWKISMDCSSQSGVLKDAYGDWTLSDLGTGLRWGQFKEPFLDSGLSSGSRQLMIDRTLSGDVNDERQLGAMYYGTARSGDIDWYVAVQNGLDGVAEKSQFSARGVWHLATGEHDGETVKAFDKYQGALGSHGQRLFSVGVAIQTDGEDASGDDRNKLGLEAEYAWKNVYAHAEKVHYDDGIEDSGAHKTLSGTSGPGTVLADTCPCSFTISHLFGDQEQYEAALRHEDHDDAADTTRTTLGFNYYRGGDPNVRWQVNLSSFDSDNDDIDGTVLEAGLVVRI